MKYLIIMRGLPGSGKSTFARTIPGAKIVSADHYFMFGDKYTFDPAKLPLAHKYCFDRAQYLMRQDASIIVLDNTNTRKWEYEKYLDLAKEYGYQPVEIKMLCDVDTAFSRNIHSVPLETIERMKNRWED